MRILVVPITVYAVALCCFTVPFTLGCAGQVDSGVDPPASAEKREVPGEEQSEPEAPATAQRAKDPEPASDSEGAVVWNSMHFNNWQWRGMPVYHLGSWKPGIVSELPVLETEFGLALGGSEVNDLGLKELRDHVNLRYLNLFGTKVTDIGMSEVAKHRELRYLELSGTAVSDGAMKTLAAALTSLEMVRLHDGQVTAQGIEDLLDLPKLNTLDVELTSDVVDLLAERNKLYVLPFAEAEDGKRPTSNDEVIRIHCESLDPRNTAKIVEHLQALKNLRELSLINATNLGLQSFAKLSNLKSLYVREGNGSHRYIYLDQYAAAAISSVEHLSLAAAEIQGMEWLPAIPNLRTLALAKTEFKRKDFQSIADCERLESLSIFRIPPSRDTQDLIPTGDSRLHDEDIATLAALRNLKSLSLDHRHYSIFGPQSLAAFSELEHLESLTIIPTPLGFIDTVGSAPRFAESLAKFKSLKSTTIDWTLSDDDLRDLIASNTLHYLPRARVTDDAPPKNTQPETVRPQNDDQIRVLDLTNTRLTAAGLQPLTQLKNLEVLTAPELSDEFLKGVLDHKLTHTLVEPVAYAAKGRRATKGDVVTGLDLRSSQVTDGFFSEAALDSVEWLNVSGTAVTDAALFSLSDLKHLKSLVVTDSEITKQGVEQFLFAKKDCVVSHGELVSALNDESLRFLLEHNRVEDFLVEQGDGKRKLNLNSITDETIRILVSGGRMSLLPQYVHFAYPNKRDDVWHLALSSTAVTDSCIDELFKMKDEITLLGLENTAITDAGLRRLAEFENLRGINLKGTKVTIQAIEAFQRQRPKCTVHDDNSAETTSN